MLIAGNELQELPYGPGGHPNPIGAPDEDCSSTISYVLIRAGLRPLAEIVRENPLAQDYVGWGEPGPGRWVTIYATDSPTPHVFAVIAGLRLDTSHDGTDVGPNRGPGRTPLADLQPHTDVGALVGPAPARALTRLKKEPGPQIRVGSRRCPTARSTTS